MKQLINIIIICAISALNACSGNGNKIKHPKELVVNVENVWMLENPNTDNLVYRLSTGNTCEILERSEKVIINGMEDYWYRVKFNDKVGWVLGTETNLKTGISANREDFKAFFIRFLEDSYQAEDLNKYLHPEIGIYGANNPGAYCIMSRTLALINQSVPAEEIPMIFERSPKGNYCDGFKGEKSGLYILPDFINELPQFPIFDDNGDIKTTPIILPKSNNPIVYKKVKVIVDEQFESDIYFANIDYKWYLILEDLCDCSA